MTVRRFIAGAVAFFVAVISVAVPTMAQQSSGLQISPTRTELTVEPGSSVSFDIDLKNVTQGTIDAKVTVDDFLPAEDGSPRILTNQDEPQAQSIKPFVKPIDDIRLEAGNSTKATFSAEVPAGQAAGAYYGVVRFQALPGTDDNGQGGGQVALSASVGHIVLIQVPGNVTEKLQLISVKAEKNGKTSNIFAAVPDKVRLDIKNTGNSFVKPFGTVTVSKGGKDLYTYQLNNEDVKANVIPNTNRVFKNDIKDVKGFGKFTITANVTYGNGGEILTQKATFWVVPVWLAVAVGLAIVVIVLAVLIATRRMKKRR